ncbi:MAG: glutathione S-transferase N-terminal domain-containing protein [Phycisphaerae bacterium]|nr:glutathione S-transferase N-terminal domain-containing protein [Phycisphaerae bacterium]
MGWIRRWVKGLITALERCVAPKSIERDSQEQAAVDGQTADLAVYEFAACPFCIKLRRAIARLNLKVPSRDTRLDPSARAELVAGGGKHQVPCLRIPGADGAEQWMYESDDIIDYLESRFGS